MQAPPRGGVIGGVRRRLALCPVCRHTGAISANTPTSARLRCVACGAKMRVRQAVGERPTPYRPASPTTLAKRSAVKAVLDRYGGDPVLDDPLHDLWPGK